MSNVTLEALVGHRKRCPSCGESKLNSGFYTVKARAGRNGLSSWCRSCTASKEAARRDARIAAELAAKADRRLCCACKVEKPIDEFTPRSWKCRPCAAAYVKKRRKANPDSARNSWLKYQYNITLDEYNEMLLAQGGVCAICGRPPKMTRLHIDHDHRCCPQKGKSCGRCIRGLLCYSCNGKLGILESESEYAVRLRAYIGVKVVWDV